MSELYVMYCLSKRFCTPSDTAYGCARPPQPIEAAALRERGIKLRDATSFGLPGWWRLSAQRPETLAALDAALCALETNVETSE